MSPFLREVRGQAPRRPKETVECRMQKEMLEGMGDILTKHGAALKERAKASSK